MPQKIAVSLFYLIKQLQFRLFSEDNVNFASMDQDTRDSFGFSLDDLAVYIKNLELTNNNAMLLLSSLKLLANSYDYICFTDENSISINFTTISKDV